MGNPRTLPLPLRTILVSTRAAAKRHRDAGDDVLLRASVERGLVLLERLRAAVPHDAPVEDLDLHEQVERDLRRMIEESREPLSPRE